MIAGQTSSFAIEPEITRAFEKPSWRGLGAVVGGGVHKSNLLEGRVINISAPFSRAFLLLVHHQSLLGSTEPTFSWNQLHV
jgi:hypothetical protein